MRIELLVGIAVGIALGLGVVQLVRERRRRRHLRERRGKRIAFPFVGEALSERALEAALRLSRAENATLVPIYLVAVPRQMPLDSPMPRECEGAFPLLDAIEQRAAKTNVPVDSRIQPGRDHRHALQQLIEHEDYERIVIPAATNATDGFDAEEIAWLLQRAPEEIVVLRPARQELAGEDSSKEAERKESPRALRTRYATRESRSAPAVAGSSRPAR